MSKPYTLNELLIISIAKEIHDYENVVLGQGIPMTSGALAKALYAPNCVLMMESGIIDFKPTVPLNHIADCLACRGFSFSTNLFTSFTMTYRGFVDVCFLGVAQVDKFGNLNTTVIGEYDAPKLKLPGSGGAADFMSYSKRTILTLRGGEFVEKLPYVTSPGYLDGGDSRDRTGHFPKGSGPSRLISTKGVFEFDPVSKEMFLAKIHPGASVAEIKKKVPWDLKVSPNLVETERPTDDEIEFVRRFAPTESLGKNLTNELAIAKMEKQAK